MSSAGLCITKASLTAAAAMRAAGTRMLLKNATLRVGLQLRVGVGVRVLVRVGMLEG